MGPTDVSAVDGVIHDLAQIWSEYCTIWASDLLRPMVSGGTGDKLTLAHLRVAPVIVSTDALNTIKDRLEESFKFLDESSRVLS